MPIDKDGIITSKEEKRNGINLMKIPIGIYPMFMPDGV